MSHLDSVDHKLAKYLGWFSIGLGTAQMLAPDKVNAMLGIRAATTTNTVERVFGAREFSAGVGLLTQPDPTPWLWARVAGDALDAMALGKALRSDRRRALTVVATVAALAATAIDVYAAVRCTQHEH